MRVDKYAMRRAPQYLPSFLLMLVYAIVLEYIVRSRDWFRYYPDIDNLMHLGWGAVISLGIITFWRNDAKFVLIAVFLWQVVWESSEMIGDRVMHQPEYMWDQPFPDGALDTLMDLLGATVVLLLTRKSRRWAQSPSSE